MWTEISVRLLELPTLKCLVSSYIHTCAYIQTHHIRTLLRIRTLTHTLMLASLIFVLCGTALAERHETRRHDLTTLSRAVDDWSAYMLVWVSLGVVVHTRSMHWSGPLCAQRERECVLCLSVCKCVRKPIYIRCLCRIMIPSLWAWGTALSSPTR